MPWRSSAVAGWVAAKRCAPITHAEALLQVCWGEIYQSQGTLIKMQGISVINIIDISLVSRVDAICVFHELNSIALCIRLVVIEYR
jgi:hypothetical protein